MCSGPRRSSWTRRSGPQHRRPAGRRLDRLPGRDRGRPGPDPRPAGLSCVRAPQLQCDGAPAGALTLARCPPRGSAGVRRREAEQRQHVLVRAVTAPRRAEPLRTSGVRREVGIDLTLDVHLLPARKPLRHQHHLGQLAAQMPGDPQRQPGGARLPAQRLCREFEQLAHATRQPPEVFTVNSGRHGWGWGAHPINNAGEAAAVPSQQAPPPVRDNDRPACRAGPPIQNYHLPARQGPATQPVPRTRRPRPHRGCPGSHTLTLPGCPSRAEISMGSGSRSK
jgi:hypothetical protein